ncbi:unnamed protein product [Sphagnum tenellum]
MVVVGPSGEEKNGVRRSNASNSAMNGVQILRLFRHVWYTSNDIPTKLGQANYLSRIIGVQFVKCYAVQIGLSTQASCKHLASVVVESNPCLTLSCKQSDACHDGQPQLEWAQRPESKSSVCGGHGRTRTLQLLFRCIRH